MSNIKFEQRVEVYDRLLSRHGLLMQSIVALEELSEAQKEICKCLRDKGNLDHLAEEIADAAIMLEQMTHYFGIDEQVREHMDKKVRRSAALLELDQN